MYVLLRVCLHLCGVNLTVLQSFIMSKIKLKCNETTSAVRLDVLQIFRSVNIRCSRLVSINNNKNLLAICHSDCDADQIFSNECLVALSAIGCTPIMPAHVKAKRSVLVKRVDAIIYDNASHDILKEINEHNEGIAATDVFKFPNSRIIKVTCANRTMALNCVKNGLRMFYLYVSPDDITGEEFHDVKICFKCYTFENHFSHELSLIHI